MPFPDGRAGFAGGFMDTTLFSWKRKLHVLGMFSHEDAERALFSSPFLVDVERGRIFPGYRGFVRVFHSEIRLSRPFRDPVFPRTATRPGRKESRDVEWSTRKGREEMPAGDIPRSSGLQKVAWRIFLEAGRGRSPCFSSAGAGPRGESPEGVDNSGCRWALAGADSLSRSFSHAVEVPKRTW